MTILLYCFVTILAYYLFCYTYIRITVLLYYLFYYITIIFRIILLVVVTTIQQYYIISLIQYYSTFILYYNMFKNNIIVILHYCNTQLCQFGARPGEFLAPLAAEELIAKVGKHEVPDIGQRRPAWCETCRVPWQNADKPPHYQRLQASSSRPRSAHASFKKLPWP